MSSIYKMYKAKPLYLLYSVKTSKKGEQNIFRGTKLFVSFEVKINKSFCKLISYLLYVY